MLLYIKTKKFQPGGLFGYNNQLADPTNPFATPSYGGMSKDLFGKAPTSLTKSPFEKAPAIDYSKGMSKIAENPFSTSMNTLNTTPNKGLLYSGAGDYSTKFAASTATSTATSSIGGKGGKGGSEGSEFTDTLKEGDAGKNAAATTAGIGLVSNALTANTYEGPKDPTRYTREDGKNDLKKSTSKGLTTGASLGATVGTAMGATTATAIGSSLGISASLAAGVAVPVVGAVVVGLGFAISSLLGRKKKKRAAARARERQIASLNAQQRAERKAELQTGTDTSVNAPTPTAYGASQPSTYGVARKGGVLYSKKKVLATPMLKKGGPIKEYENIIPNGVLHEEENSLGDKGMPVVKCVSNVCTKKYEIEKEELIFTLDTTKKVEQLAKSKNHKALGEYVKEQLLDNTHSFSDKFSELNNR